MALPHLSVSSSLQTLCDRFIEQSMLKWSALVPPERLNTLLKINFPNVWILHLRRTLLFRNIEEDWTFCDMTPLNIPSIRFPGFGSVLLFSMKREVHKRHYLIPDQCFIAKSSHEVQIYYMWNIVAYDWPCWKKMDVMIQCVIICIGSTAISQSVGLFLPWSALWWSDEGVNLGQNSFGHYSVPDH